MTEKKIRWGIISTARIGETAFIPATRQTERGEIVAVASRDQERGEAFAKKHDIPQVFGDYASMLASDEIDAVYNPLPNTLHAEWTKRAAQEGKHVFCEKPLAMSAAEADEMVAACRDAGVLLFEAFVFLYHPQTLKLRQLLDEGVIGDLLHVQAHMSFNLARPTDNIRLNKEVGGGGLWDAGVYPITFVRFAFGAEPEKIQASYHIDPDYGVDTRTAILLTFAGDRFGTIQTGMDAFGGQGATLIGEKGHIVIPQPYHPSPQSHFVIRTRDSEETVEFDTGVVPFAPAIEHFHACILDGETPIITAENAAGSLRIVETILSR